MPSTVAEKFWMGTLVSIICRMKKRHFVNSKANQAIDVTGEKLVYSVKTCSYNISWFLLSCLIQQNYVNVNIPCFNVFKAFKLFVGLKEVIFLVVYICGHRLRKFYDWITQSGYFIFYCFPRATFCQHLAQTRTWRYVGVWHRQQNSFTVSIFDEDT